MCAERLHPNGIKPPLSALPPPRFHSNSHVPGAWRVAVGAVIVGAMAATAMVGCRSSEPAPLTPFRPVAVSDKPVDEEFIRPLPSSAQPPEPATPRPRTAFEWRPAAVGDHWLELSQIYFRVVESSREVGRDLVEQDVQQLLTQEQRRVRLTGLDNGEAQRAELRYDIIVSILQRFTRHVAVAEADHDGVASDDTGDGAGDGDDAGHENSAGVGQPELSAGQNAGMAELPLPWALMNRRAFAAEVVRPEVGGWVVRDTAGTAVIDEVRDAVAQDFLASRDAVPLRRVFGEQAIPAGIAVPVPVPVAAQLLDLDVPRIALKIVAMTVVLDRISDTHAVFVVTLETRVERASLELPAAAMRWIGTMHVDRTTGWAHAIYLTLDRQALGDIGPIQIDGTIKRERRPPISPDSPR